jgi:hypothetical protein
LHFAANTDSCRVGFKNRRGGIVANKRYVVKLSAEERTRLNVLISRGKAAAKTILKSRILLKADESEVGEGCASTSSRSWATWWHWPSANEGVTPG